MQEAVKAILKHIGENPKREGLRDTPMRVRKSFEFLTQGYKQDPQQIIGKAIFREKCDHMIIVRDIEIYSLCEHHLL
ncbi:MAG: GTP cyclohydrolase I, partial [Chitinivibrionales bacterium]|nr:GTP cyclohydrolase I [Chitinivibrionales bacterium]